MNVASISQPQRPISNVPLTDLGECAICRQLNDTVQNNIRRRAGRQKRQEMLRKGQIELRHSSIMVQDGDGQLKQVLKDPTDVKNWR